MEPAEYAARDATALAELVKTGDVSADELHDAALRAIEAVDAQLNAVVHGPFDDLAYDARGPFAGVPFAIKDTLWEAGRPVEFGSRLLAGHVARRDQTLAERFRAAGLACLVRAATPEFGFCADTAPIVNGPTLNPWNVERSPGGSSGGSAALVAARALPMGHANDGGGSIRIPAAWCGLVGLKPSRGRVPAGPMIGEAPGAITHELAVTRTVRDTARLLDAVCGPAPGDRYYVAKPERPFAEQVGARVEPLRVALALDAPWGMAPEPDVRAAVERVAGVLEDLGHRVEPAAPRVDVERLRTAGLVFWSLMMGGMAAALSRQLERPIDETTLEPATLAFVRHGFELRGLEVSVAEAAFNRHTRAWGRFLDEYDVLLTPTLPTTAPPSGWAAQDSTPDAVAYEQRLFDRVPYTPLANATGQPAISLPLAVASDGLPIGVMFTAQTLREDLLLRLAAQLEEAMPWADRVPPVRAG